jgi:hypothetical protein
MSSFGSAAGDFHLGRLSFRCQKVGEDFEAGVNKKVLMMMIFSLSFLVCTPVWSRNSVFPSPCLFAEVGLLYLVRQAQVREEGCRP